MRAEWEMLPREEKLLFNPAFLALLLARCSRGYQSILKEPIPIPLSFVALTIALNRPTRELLPKSVATNLVHWIQEHPEVRAITPMHAVASVPLLREGLLFALTQRICLV